MLDLDDVQTDRDKADGGVWVDFETFAKSRAIITRTAPPRDRACILVGRWNCSAHAAAMIENVDPLRELFQKAQVPAEVFQKAMRKAHAGLVRGWSGFTRGGKPWEYSRENAQEAMQSERWLLFQECVFETARREAEFMIKRVEEAKGN